MENDWVMSQKERKITSCETTPSRVKLRVKNGHPSDVSGAADHSADIGWSKKSFF